jgi:AraC-like DNA-binding protein
MSREITLFRGRQFEVGEVRCLSADPELERLGPIRGWCVSFPRLPLHLRARRQARFLADRATALFLAPGAVLDRSALTGDGSRCHWLAIDEPLAAESLAQCDDAQRRSLERNGYFSLVKSPALALCERRMFRCAATPALDGGDLESLACSVLDSAIAASTRAAARPADRALAEAACAILALSPSQPLRSGLLADRLGVSVFHLCRGFRRATGLTLQEYARRLRLDLALERLAEPDVDLSTLAQDLGFSSHSHFSVAFRGVFGLTPSAYRERRRRRAIA